MLFYPSLLYQLLILLSYMYTTKSLQLDEPRDRAGVTSALIVIDTVTV